MTKGILSFSKISHCAFLGAVALIFLQCAQAPPDYTAMMMDESAEPLSGGFHLAPPASVGLATLHLILGTNPSAETAEFIEGAWEWFYKLVPASFFESSWYFTPNSPLITSLFYHNLGVGSGLGFNLDNVLAPVIYLKLNFDKAWAYYDPDWPFSDDGSSSSEFKPYHLFINYQLNFNFKNGLGGSLEFFKDPNPDRGWYGFINPEDCFRLAINIKSKHRRGIFNFKPIFQYFLDSQKIRFDLHFIFPGFHAISFSAPGKK